MAVVVLPKRDAVSTTTPCQQRSLFFCVLWADKCTEEKRPQTWVETRRVEHVHVVKAHLTTAELLQRNAWDMAGSSHSQQQTYHGACCLKSARKLAGL